VTQQHRTHGMSDAQCMLRVGSVDVVWDIACQPPCRLSCITSLHCVTQLCVYSQANMSSPQPLRFQNVCRRKSVDV
jgi:hypothetical protein